MAILFMIGQKIEKPNIIPKLLDVNLVKQKPNYDYAEGQNLILSDCGFEGIKWQNSNFFADYESY